MTDRIRPQPAHAFLACGQLPGRETNLAPPEMRNASGGIGMPPILPVAIARLIAEAVVDYFDD